MKRALQIAGGAVLIASSAPLCGLANACGSEAVTYRQHLTFAQNAYYGTLGIAGLLALVLAVTAAGLGVAIIVRAAGGPD